MNEPIEGRITRFGAEALDAGRHLADVYRARQHRQATFGGAKPERAPADETTWFGGRKYSPAARQHNQRLDAIEFAEIEAEYALRQGLRLEYVGVDEGSRTVAAEVEVLRNLPSDSLEAVITQELILHSVDRIHRIAGEATEQYLRKALR